MNESNTQYEQRGVIDRTASMPFVIGKATLLKRARREVRKS
jgi:hypothetical protein